MKQPVVAIIGRPNVGKSTFFNLLVGKNLAIVDSTPGVTRDRIIEIAEWQNRTFNVVDTGGIDFDEKTEFNIHIREQVNIAIDLADVIVFLTDGSYGVHQDDEAIAKLLRKTKKPIILAVNKIDNNKRDIYDFYKLGLGEPMAISCTQKTGLGDLLDKIVYDCGGEQCSTSSEVAKRIAIVGKPNAGKSSILNKLLGENRVMVSDIPGTTRDTIDAQIRVDGKDYILTDTAGIRRKRSVEIETVEHYSVLRAIASIRNSDVTILVVDATEGLTEQDVRLIGYAHEAGKPSIVCINKWDLVEKDSHTINEYKRNLERDLAFMAYFVPIFISAKTGQRIGEIMKHVERVLENSEKRLATGTLNKLIMGFVATNPSRAKFKYVTQVGVTPPTFALFVNDIKQVEKTYTKYLENCLRKAIDLTGTPVRFILRDSR